MKNLGAQTGLQRQASPQTTRHGEKNLAKGKKINHKAVTIHAH